MILIALDENGRRVYAKDAKSQVDYFCLCCGCRMHVRKSTLGNVFFFALDGGHQSSDCRDAGEEDAAARDPELLSVSKFQNAVMRVRKEKGTGDGGGGSGGGGPAKEVLPPCNLRQLQLSGALSLPPNTPIEGGVLSDILLTHKSFSEFIAPHSSLGFRVLELSLDSAFNWTIRLKGWWGPKWQRYRAFFDIQVDKSVDFDALVNNYFSGISLNKNGITYNQPKYERALVAGVWTAVNNDECQKTCFYCKNARTPCVGLQRATLASKNQIFCADVPKNRTEHHPRSS